MNDSSFSAALFVLLGLAACAPPPDAPPPGQEEVPPLAEARPEEPSAPLDKPPAEIPPPAAQVQSRRPGEVAMRHAALPADEISLWHDDESALEKSLWDGADIKTVAQIFPLLIDSNQSRVKALVKRIAFSAVRPPAGMSDHDYLRWRAAALYQQKHYAEAARLLHMMRLGRDSRADLEPRLKALLANGQSEAACLEAIAEGGGDTLFWRGLEVLCAQHLGDGAAAKKLRTALPEGEWQQAAETPEKLQQKLISAPVPDPAAREKDNPSWVQALQQKLAAVTETENPETELRREQGEILLLALGALAAHTQAEDTDKVTGEALKKLGL